MSLFLSRPEEDKRSPCRKSTILSHKYKRPIDPQEDGCRRLRFRVAGWPCRLNDRADRETFAAPTSLSAYRFVRNATCALRPKFVEVRRGSDSMELVESATTPVQEFQHDILFLLARNSQKDPYPSTRP